MKRRLFSMLLVLSMVLAFLPAPVSADASNMTSGNLNAASPSKKQLQTKWKEITSATSLYGKAPSASAPYKTGSLSDSFLQSGITYLNYVRYAAHLPQVQLDDTLNKNAQYGAVLLAAVNTLTHDPSQPADMDDTFYQRGASATGTSNLAALYGYNSMSSLQNAVQGCMDDKDISNMASVGHRRWLLNPTLLNVGFGYAQSSTGWSYIAIKVFDNSGADVSYDFISWPASGNFPTNLFAVWNPWSITLNPDKYKTPSQNDVKVTITRESDGRVWTFDSTTGSPSSSSGAYMTVDTSSYGISNCIIFHPGSANIDAYSGVYTVDVSGIYYWDGSAATLHYQVDFFDVETYATAKLSAPDVTAKNVASSGKIQLSWDKVKDAESYRIYRATSKNGTYEKIKTTSETSYTDSSAKAGKQYYYKVKAVGNGSTSKSSSVKSLFCDLPRPDVTVTNTTSTGKVKLSWKAIDGAEKYDVYRATSKSGEYEKVKTTTSTTYTDSSAKVGKTYYYQVVAVHAKSSANSAKSTVDGGVRDLARPDVTVTNTASTGKVKLSWKAIDGAEKYVVYRATSKSGEFKKVETTTSNTYTDSSAKVGKTYYYKVVAVHANSTANSAKSTVGSGVRDLVQPDVTVKLNSSNQPKVSWETIEGAENYIVYRSTAKNGEYTKLTTTTKTAYTDKTAEAGNTYYYKVKAIHEKSAANSASSSVDKIHVP